MSNKYIQIFYEDVCKNLGENYKIVLEPNRIMNEDWVEYDSINWEMEDGISNLVNDLLQKEDISLEDKIIKVYEYICLNYIYDANVLFFFRKDKDGNHIPADWYGRTIDYNWVERRKVHNRRICYEFSRFFAKAINILVNNEEDTEAFILGDKSNTHYVVGLAGEKYNVILDQDDFNSIKDLTRLKLGLTIEGIHILNDITGVFQNALLKYNNTRLKELKEFEEAKKQYLKDSNAIEFFLNCITALKKYNIDSQGFFEVMRSIIESTGIEIEKIWKEDKNKKEKRYERCLYFQHEDNTYLLDSINKTLTVTNIAQLNCNIFIFNPEGNEYDYYGG